MITVVHVGRKQPEDDLVMEMSALLCERKKVVLVVHEELLQNWLRQLQRFRVPCARGDVRSNWEKGRIAIQIGDEARAGELAIELQASVLMFVTRVMGFLNESCHPFAVLSATGAEEAMASGLIDGRMALMVRAGQAALRSGVQKVSFGRSPLRPFSRLL